MPVKKRSRSSRLQYLKAASPLISISIGDTKLWVFRRVPTKYAPSSLTRYPQGRLSLIQGNDEYTASVTIDDWFSDREGYQVFVYGVVPGNCAYIEVDGADEANVIIHRSEEAYLVIAPSGSVSTISEVVIEVFTHTFKTFPR